MKHKGFTLLELLIIIALFAVLSVVAIVLLNPMSLVKRATDVTRKKELDDAKKMLEQYMSDTGCYPKPTQICAQNAPGGSCNFCANGKTTQFSYFTKDVCDPRHGISDYLYETEITEVPKSSPIAASCPKWFRIYSVLDSAYDEATDVWNCSEGGCGIAPNYGYDYLVTSPGAPTTTISTNDWYCYTTDCTNCYSFENCHTVGNDCVGKVLYPSKQSCCAQHNPNSPNCL